MNRIASSSPSLPQPVITSVLTTPTSGRRMPSGSVPPISAFRSTLAAVPTLSGLPSWSLYSSRSASARGRSPISPRHQPLVKFSVISCASPIWSRDWIAWSSSSWNAAGSLNWMGSAVTPLVSVVSTCSVTTAVASEFSTLTLNVPQAASKRLIPSNIAIHFIFLIVFISFSFDRFDSGHVTLACKHYAPCSPHVTTRDYSSSLPGCESSL
jgi:hypothetical protein